MSLVSNDVSFVARISISTNVNHAVDAEPGSEMDRKPEDTPDMTKVRLELCAKYRRMEGGRRPDLLLKYERNPPRGMRFGLYSLRKRVKRFHLDGTCFDRTFGKYCCTLLYDMPHLLWSEQTG